MASSALRKVLKTAVLPWGFSHRRRAEDLLILLYHRIGPSDAEISLSSTSFESQIAGLAKHDRVITLDNALTNGEAGGVVITFDDGYKDFYDIVAPILTRYEVPATLYLQTGLVASKADGDRLTWSQLAELRSTGRVTVGAHTHSHPNLSALSERQVDDEMRRSQELIEDRLQSHCRHFAYPYGVASLEAERAARRLFDSAALGNWKTNRRGSINPYALGRVPVLRSDGRLLFRAKRAGWLEREAVAYRMLRRGPWTQN